MSFHRAYRTLACLSLTLPAVAWAGFAQGTSTPLLLLIPVMLVVSAVMLLMLVISLFSSGRTRTLQTFVVAEADLAAAGLIMAFDDGLAEALAWYLVIVGALLLFIALLVYAGEAMLKETKPKRRPSRPSRQPPVSDSE